MKKITTLLTVLLLVYTSSIAQVGIGTTSPDISSILELNSTTQGLLTTRLTTTQRDDISSPAEGLLIYNLDTNCFQYFNGANWSACLGDDQAVKTLVCPPNATSSGIFVAATALTSNNKITVSVTTFAATTYSITTDTQNGYSFSAVGSFPSAGDYEVILTGSGTPISAQTDTFTISMADATGTCTANVEVLAVAPPIYANCKEYKANGYNTDGIYTIDPDGTGVGNDEYDCYCDMTNDGGGWTLVLRHDSTDGYFTNDAQADSNNESSPSSTATKYSILNKIDEIKSETEYEFRLYYPNENIRNHWTQTFNPRSGQSGTSPVAGYTAINVDATGSFWGGIDKASSSSTFLNGSVNHGNWWYAIGSNTAHGGGIPGPDNTVVNVVELYIR